MEFGNLYHQCGKMKGNSFMPLCVPVAWEFCHAVYECTEALMSKNGLNIYRQNGHFPGSHVVLYKGKHKQ